MDALIGMRAGLWLRLVRENRFAIDPRYWHRAALLTLRASLNSRAARREEREYRPKVEDVEIRAPLVIIGHWRSGTTLLHNLLAKDEAFVYPNLLQISNPHTFLGLQERMDGRIKVKPRKRPMDNMTITMFSPGEEEFALASMTRRSPLIGWSFPRREAHYDRYLTFDGVPPDEVDEWKRALVYFFKKIAWKYPGRRLLLKSPAHTARVHLLLDLFPDARFIHIHRDPYTVFKSTVRLYEKAVPRSHLQTSTLDSRTDRIIERYRRMYDAYLDQRQRIPDGRLCEVRYEDLEMDMLGEIARVYEVLGLEGFPEVEPKLREYVESLRGYEKTRHPMLPPELRRRIAREWSRSFDEWSYAT